MNVRHLALSFVLAMGLHGCAYYTTPGGPASIPALTDADIAEALAREPAAQFPVRIIVARVQAAGYESRSNRGYGTGRYSVVTTRDFETDYDFNRIGSLRDVVAVGALSRVLLPSELSSARELRTAAAQLRGDILLLYTVDTVFRTERDQIGPLQLVALGFFPSHRAQVTATCATAFIDVRTGYVYGIAEGTATEEQRSTLWGSSDAIETARLEAERKAFQLAIGDIERVWVSIRNEHGNAATVVAQ